MKNLVRESKNTSIKFKTIKAKLIRKIENEK